MKAILAHQYGPPDVLQLEDIEKPVPNENQILVKVHATSINAQEYRMRLGKPIFLRIMMGAWRKPKSPRVGSDVAGQVEAVGENIKKFRPGDEVFGVARGAIAEYVLAKDVNLVTKPANRSFEQAAAVPVAGLTALQGLRDFGGIKAGQKVLIQGASGGVGTMAVQIAKAYGAEVTAVCSTRNQEMARSIGADHVIDYKKEDFTRKQERYDLIYAANGYHSLSAYKRALKPGGIYVCAGGTLPQIFQAMILGKWMSRNGDKTLTSMGIAKVEEEDLETLAEYLESGKIAPFIDATYPLVDTVKAFWYVEDKHPQGKVVITM